MHANVSKFGAAEKVTGARIGKTIFRQNYQAITFFPTNIKRSFYKVN
jgi:hypothetical protein